MLTARRADTDNPQTAELTLALAAVAVRVAPRVHNRFFGPFIVTTRRGLVTLGGLEDFLVAGALGNASFYSGHGVLFSGIKGRMEPNGSAA